MNIETKICKWCKENFPLYPDDLSFYKKIDVPTPTLCPKCRYVRRLLDRNEWSLYRRKCDFTGELIVSIYRQDAPFPVYKQDVWRSDNWDPMQYGRNFDFNRPFFEQYEELRRAVPHIALVNFNSINSEYTNQSVNNKDCYMISASGGAEKCMYGNWYQPTCFWSADCYMALKIEFCYECINVARCSNCTWCQDCFDCVNVNFSIDCRGCTDCFGCIGLRNKQYCWFNEQLSKEVYEKRLKEFEWSRKAIEDTKRQVLSHHSRIPIKYYHGVQIQNSTGDYLQNAQRARLAFNCREIKDVAYVQDVWQMEDSLDITEIYAVEQSYELQGVSNVLHSIAIRSSGVATDSYYCDMSNALGDCFGCFSLKQKQYCILNKQYSKEEYFALKKKIIEHMKKTGEWGEYFPPEVSPFAYNESMAQDYFPLSREEALQKGYPWYDKPESQKYTPTMTSEKLPPRISETPASIIEEIIRCSSQDSEEEKRKHPECTAVFRLIPLEVELYKKLGIPVPAKCFPCRRSERFSFRNPRTLYSRTCDCAGATSSNNTYKNTAPHFHGESKCPNEFETSYAPDRPEIIYCEQCYNAEVI